LKFKKLIKMKLSLKNISIVLALLTLVISPSCNKEFLNPNAATKDEVLASPDGLMAMIVGMRRTWTVGGSGALYTNITCNGLTTRELYVINTGNGDLAAVEAGKTNLGNANSTMSNLWSGCNQIKTHAQLVLDNLNVIGDAGTRAGVQAYAHFWKALALGTMAQYWEQVPTEFISSADYQSGKRASFTPRAEALKQAIQLLKDATTLLQSTPVSATFTSKIGSDIDILNACRALTARYSLFAGSLDDALAAASSVDLSKVSTFKYDAANVNPVFRSSLFNNNTYGGLANFGLSGVLAPDTADRRIPFYLGSTGLARATGFFKSDLDAIPVYIPNEMTLIKAEVFARQNKADSAVANINRVRQKTADPLGITARLGAYKGSQTQPDLLIEIYKQRCIELYMSGLKLEDSRRFNRPGPNEANNERSRNFYPYPQAEKDNNAGTPADPAL
jgi:starch-binding outer membrane protein, SusD/RagB family